MKSFKSFLIEERQHDNENEFMAAGAIVKAMDTGRLGLGLRSKSCSEPGTWGCLGGGAVLGETPVQCIVREIMEEAGLQVSPKFLEHIHTFRKADGSFSYHTFIWHVPTEKHVDDNIKLNEEHTAFDWCHIDDMLKPLHPGIVRSMQGNREYEEKLRGRFNG